LEFTFAESFSKRQEANTIGQSVHLAKKTPYAAGVGVHKASTGLRNEKRRFSICISVIHLGAHSSTSSWNATNANG